MVTYEELTPRLALDLAFLKIGDFISLRANGPLVQAIQNADSLTAELSPSRPVTDDERQSLVDDGWQEPHRGQPTWLRHTPWPLNAATAHNLASSMIDAARTFVSPDITHITYDARNYDTWEPIHPPSLDGLRREPDPSVAPVPAMRRVSLRAWRGQHYIGLAELLCALGRTTAGALWELEVDDVAPSPEGDNLRALASGQRISTLELILTVFPDAQIIDGQLRAFAAADDTVPFLVLYAVDSTDWDLESADSGTIAAIHTAFPEAIDVGTDDTTPHRGAFSLLNRLERGVR